MKAIIDITEEGFKYAKMLCMSGVADEFHEAIANGMPIIDGSELASLLIEMRVNEEIHDTTFIILRENDNYNNEVMVKRYKTDEEFRCQECGAMMTEGSVEQNPNKWIPVSERLPNDAYGCIVTVWDVDLRTHSEFENILPYFVGYDGETWNNAGGEPIPYEVIAWMKAPEPYKAEGSDS